MTTRPAAGATALLLGSILLGAALLAGCTSPAPDPAPSPIAADPVEVCAEFSDVETIILNAGSALRDGRMQQHEHAGWLRVAQRVLSRIDADTATALGAAIAAAQEAAPATPIGIVGEDFDPLSPAWGQATTAVRTACSAAGADVVGEGFTGG